MRHLDRELPITLRVLKAEKVIKSIKMFCQNIATNVHKRKLNVYHSNKGQH